MQKSDGKPGSWVTSEPTGWWAWASWAAAVVIALIPPVVMLHFINTTGGEALSNDYLLWVPLIDRLASGAYPWADYLRDSFQAGSHCFALPVLVTLFIARVFAWSVAATLALGFALSVVKTALLYDLFSRGTAPLTRRLALPVLSALVFMPAHVNSFTFGFTATHVGLCELGLVLAVWAVARFPGRWLGIGLACVGSAMASWSWGSGVVVWGIIGAGLIPLGFGKRRHLGVFTLAMVLSAVPYIRYGNLAETVVNSGPEGKTSSAWLLFEGVGWPWHGTDPMRARFAGVMGLVLLAIAAFSFARRSRDRLPALIPSLMFVVYALVLIIPAVFIRTHLAPWYTTTFGFLWIGLFGLACRAEGSRELDWALMTALAVIALVLTNGGFANKAFYLKSRSPAAEACLRHYRDNLWACESSLFQWQPGHPENIDVIAEPLERHGWGPFAAHQQWTLQGDWILDQVLVDRPPGAGEPMWTASWEFEPNVVTDYRHLNLLAPSPAAVHWRVTLPQLRQGTLRTAVTLSKSKVPQARESGTKVTIRLEREGRSEVLFTTELSGREGWVPVEVPLTHVSGPVTITFTSTAPGSGRPWVLFQYPRLDLELQQPGTTPALPSSAPDDQVLDVGFTHWDPVRIAGGNDGRWQIVASDPALIYRPPLDVCVEDFTRLVLRVGVSPFPFYRNLQLYYRLASDADFSEKRSERIPLAAGPTRDYALPLRLLGLPPGERITGLRIDPLDGPATPGPTWVDLTGIRLVARGGPTRCRAP